MPCIWYFKYNALLSKNLTVSIYKLLRLCDAKHCDVVCLPECSQVVCIFVSGLC